ncbi:hypothetical protein [Alicyclobacillus vulcanalis]|uniref:Uncharacterized protein n=1 Tax=Alicyclobacillus vulcanalis TaxID=252246 RepID=A0A1N7MGC9_9BACL|nr:hypothetical protein [Alicyclobacillus vulcanalis]SIS85196.1 hypothetical protein SAMN05421799_105132 [Alicyclobacillus vulcanalis]
MLWRHRFITSRRDRRMGRAAGLAALAAASALTLMPAPVPRAGTILPGRVPFTLKASEIIAQNAVISILNESMSFSSASIQGMSITYSSGGHTFTIAVNGTSSAGPTVIKTSLFSTLKDDIGSLFHVQSPSVAVVLADALISKPIPTLVLTNVNLTIDTSMQAQSLQMPGMQMSVN